jgi:uncharacterized protein (TIGR02996 family)
MSDEAAFLDHLKDHPGDDTARLVFADFLEEQTQTAKSQYLRAVVELTRHAGGTVEFTAAAERLYCACAHTDQEWRAAAGARFDVVLEGYGPFVKVQTIVVIRARTGCGLGAAKALAESVPNALWSWLPFERALPHLLAFHHAGSGYRPTAAVASIRPTVWPEGVVPGALFDIHLCTAEFGTGIFSPVQGLAALMGISQALVRRKLKKLPLVVGSGLKPAAVADFVRRVKMVCNVNQPLPADAIRIVEQRAGE